MEVVVFKLKNITDELELIKIASDFCLFLTEEQVDKFGATIVNDEYEFLFVTLEEFEIKKLTEVFEKHEILLSVQNITLQVLMGTAFDNKLFEESFYVDSNELEMLEKFIENNITVDMILDKMNDGKELSKIDLKVLQNV